MSTLKPSLIGKGEITFSAYFFKNDWDDSVKWLVLFCLKIPETVCKIDSVSGTHVVWSAACRLIAPCRPVTWPGLVSHTGSARYATGALCGVQPRSLQFPGPKAPTTSTAIIYTGNRAQNGRRPARGGPLIGRRWPSRRLLNSECGRPFRVKVRGNSFNSGVTITVLPPNVTHSRPHAAISHADAALGSFMILRRKLPDPGIVVVIATNVFF